MDYRLSHIVTRTGDDGITGLADGSRIGKDDLRISVIGEIDELNSRIGVLLAEALPPEVSKDLFQIQNDLFDLGGVLALPGQTFAKDNVFRLDAAIEYYNTNLPPLREFILPGGARAAALCHLARTQTRCAERNFVALMQRDNLPIDCLRYLNRLSDLLFILSRVINIAVNQPEKQWQRNGNRLE
jgi:cob(I)alamin adenosyltransferase